MPEMEVILLFSSGTDPSFPSVQVYTLAYGVAVIDITGTE
jgi:hypothetical protein